MKYTENVSMVLLPKYFENLIFQTFERFMPIFSQIENPRFFSIQHGTTIKGIEKLISMVREAHITSNI